MILLPYKGIFAYQRVSEDEYKEFLRKFIEEKYYLNNDEKADDSSVCNVGTIDVQCTGVTVSSTGGTYDFTVTLNDAYKSAEKDFSLNL